MRKYFAVSFLGHRRCKWFQGYFKWTPFANYIQVMQNLNQLYNADVNTKCVILLNFDSIWITKGAQTCPFSHSYQGCIDMIRSGIILSNTLLNPSGEGIGKYCPMQCVGKYCPREYIGNGCPRKYICKYYPRECIGKYCPRDNIFFMISQGEYQEHIL